MKYYNEPQGKVVLNSSELPRELQININGLGREIVWYSLATYLRVIELDYEQMTTISKDGRSGVINANELFKVVSKKLNANINILNVEPSNINITLDDFDTKKVPVKVVYKSLDNTSEIFGVSFRAEPDSIDIAGPKKILSKLKYWETDSLDLTGLDQGKSIRAKMREEYEIKLYPKEIMLDIEPDRFSEDELMIQIRKINVPSEVKFNLHLKKAKVSYKAPMSKLDAISEKNIRLTADFSDLDWKQESSVPLEVTKSPSYVRVSYIDPVEVKFTVEKR